MPPPHSVPSGPADGDSLRIVGNSLHTEMDDFFEKISLHSVAVKASNLIQVNTGRVPLLVTNLGQKMTHFGLTILSVW